ncbi:MAG TPA: hypothetical protein VM074_11355 [Solimonas sp.]|nr:hypothetical protein [Solimonas sp.]
MQTLADILLAPHQKDAVIDDCVKLLDHHVAHRGGLKGMAMKTGVAMLKAKRPDIMVRAVRRLLPEFAVALEPLYREFKKGPDRDFSLFLQKRAPETTGALLGVADRLIEQSQNPRSKSTYARFRGGAESEVAAIVPALSKLLSGYLP